MANNQSNSSRTHPSGSRNPRVARRDNRVPRAGPYHTQPTLSELTDRSRRHEQRLNDMEIELQETRENWSLTALGRINQLTDDQLMTLHASNVMRSQMEETVSTMETVQHQVVGNGIEITVLQSRLHEVETRLRETEDALRLVSRLAGSVDRLTELLPQLNLRQD